jgi:hypothetical protein
MHHADHALSTQGTRRDHARSALQRHAREHARCILLQQQSLRVQNHQLIRSARGEGQLRILADPHRRQRPVAKAHRHDARQARAAGTDAGADLHRAGLARHADPLRGAIAVEIAGQHAHRLGAGIERILQAGSQHRLFA